MHAMPRCPECGAPQLPGNECLTCFHALLAFENERPHAFGAVHHLTVASYYLQHPTGYAFDVLRAWRDVIADTLDGRASIRDLLRRASREFEGAKRAREPGAVAPAWWPRMWPLTVQSVIVPDEPPDVQTYVTHARAWAAETRRALDSIWAR